MTRTKKCPWSVDRWATDSCPYWQLSPLTVVRTDSCPIWQLSDLTANIWQLSANRLKAVEVNKKIPKGVDTGYGLAWWVHGGNVSVEIFHQRKNETLLFLILRIQECALKKSDWPEISATSLTFDFRETNTFLLLSFRPTVNEEKPLFPQLRGVGNSLTN